MRPPPGWYPDPTGPGFLRYWNGFSWTVDRARPSGIPATSFAEPRPPKAGAAPPPGLPGLPIAFVGFGLGFGSSILILLLLHWAGNPGGEAANLGLSELGIWAGMLGPVFLVSHRSGSGSLPKDFGWRVKPVDIGIGILGAAAGRSAVSLTALVLLPVYVQLQRQPQVGVQPSQITGATWIVFGVLVCIGAPVVEELFFRGLVQTRMVGLLGPGWGIGVTSLLFGAAHLIGWQDLSSLIAAVILAAGGGVLGFLWYRTGRLGTSTIAHAVFNSIAFAVLLATNT